MPKRIGRKILSLFRNVHQTCLMWAIALAMSLFLHSLGIFYFNPDRTQRSRDGKKRRPEKIRSRDNIPEMYKITKEEERGPCLLPIPSLSKGEPNHSTILNASPDPPSEY